MICGSEQSRLREDRRRCDDDVRRRHCLNSRFLCPLLALTGSVMCPCACARAVWAQHFDPHLLVNYLPLLFHLCIQMGLSLEAPSLSGLRLLLLLSHFVLVLHVRGIIFAKDAAADANPQEEPDRERARKKRSQKSWNFG